MKSIIFTFLFISLSFCAYAEDLKEFNITGKTVIFFSITQTEYDSKNEEEQSELVETLSDFDYYRGKIQGFLKENKIQSYQTTNSKIIVSQTKNRTTYNRKQLDHVVGVIMADQSKKPEVLLGVMTEVDLIDAVSNYFSIKTSANTYKASAVNRK
jgi:hypothetical protein